MTNVKTDPLQALPPTVGGWTIVFTRKVAATTASDGAFVDTGIVYDPAYEYLTLNRLVTAATPNPTAAASISSFYVAPNVYGTYKPDGVNTLAVTAGLLNVMIMSQQNAASLQAAAGWGTATGAEMQIDAAGKFYTQWTQDMSKDGHFCIARRPRYG